METYDRFAPSLKTLGQSSFNQSKQSISNQPIKSIQIFFKNAQTIQEKLSAAGLFVAVISKFFAAKTEACHSYQFIQEQYADKFDNEWKCCNEYQ